MLTDEPVLNVTWSTFSVVMVPRVDWGDVFAEEIFHMHEITHRIGTTNRIAWINNRVNECVSNMGIAVKLNEVWLIEASPGESSPEQGLLGQCDQQHEPR